MGVSQFILKYNREDLVDPREIRSFGLVEFDRVKSKSSDETDMLVFDKTIFSFGEIKKNWTFDYDNILKYKYIGFMEMSDYFSTHPEEYDSNGILWKVGFKPQPWIEILNILLSHEEIIFELSGEWEASEIRNNNEIDQLKKFLALCESCVEDNAIITFNYG